MDDSRIVEMYWKRDEQAIPATAQKYGSYCISIAGNILDSWEDVEECVNDAYLQAWNAMPPHRPEELSAFLGKIVRNMALNRYKHNTADKRGGGEVALVLDELSALVSGKDDVQQELNRRELAAAIDSFLDTLAPKKRAVFVSRYWYTESITAIALRYGMKPGSVSMMLNRLRRKLKHYLTERGFEL